MTRFNLNFLWTYQLYFNSMAFLPMHCAKWFEMRESENRDFSKSDFDRLYRNDWTLKWIVVFYWNFTWVFSTLKILPSDYWLFFCSPHWNHSKAFELSSHFIQFQLKWAKSTFFFLLLKMTLIFISWFDAFPYVTYNPISCHFYCAYRVCCLFSWFSLCIGCHHWKSRRACTTHSEWRLRWRFLRSHLLEMKNV